MINSVQQGCFCDIFFFGSELWFNGGNWWQKPLMNDSGLFSYFFFFFNSTKNNNANHLNMLLSNMATNWLISSSAGTSLFFWQVSSGLRDGTWLLTEHGTHTARQDLTAVGLRSEGVVLVEVERSGFRDWHVMDAGPSNSIHLFIYLPALSCLSLSSRERRADWMSTWPGKLTDSDLTWFKELVNLYDVKAWGLLVYCMLMYDIPVV